MHATHRAPHHHTTVCATPQKPYSTTHALHAAPRRAALRHATPRRYTELHDYALRGRCCAAQHTLCTHGTHAATTTRHNCNALRRHAQTAKRGKAMPGAAMRHAHTHPRCTTGERGNVRNMTGTKLQLRKAQPTEHNLECTTRDTHDAMMNLSDTFLPTIDRWKHVCIYKRETVRFNSHSLVFKMRYLTGLLLGNLGN